MNYSVEKYIAKERKTEIVMYRDKSFIDAEKPLYYFVLYYNGQYIDETSQEYDYHFLNGLGFKAALEYFELEDIDFVRIK